MSHCATSYGVYVSQLLRFARASIQVHAFYKRNKSFTTKHLKQGYINYGKHFLNLIAAILN